MLIKITRKAYTEYIETVSARVYPDRVQFYNHTNQLVQYRYKGNNVQDDDILKVEVLGDVQPQKVEEKTPETPKKKPGRPRSTKVK